MKKQYEKPELYTAAFDTEDVITASGNLPQTFTDAFQTMWTNTVGFFKGV